MERLVSLVKRLYRDDSDRVLDELIKYIHTLKIPNRSTTNYLWYKYLNLYFIYPDSLNGRGKSSMTKLIPHLDHVKELGCNALHILPFLESPMVDKGFDVSDYYSLRRGLGSFRDLERLVKKAEKLGIRLFMDLVFNHVSDQHEWFKKAEKGDKKYQNYFISTDKKPKFIRKYHKQSAVWAEYLIDKKKRSINIAFPEYAGEIPHWKEGKDGRWYYHTYYPQQLDVNWRNPDVFIEYAKIIMFWTNMGFNFRLDAIPFVGKSAYKNVDDNTEFTRVLNASFNEIAQTINPEAVFIMETYEKIHTVIDYFGTTNRKQAKLGYNFHLCTYMWVALIKKDASYIWEKLKQVSSIPTHAHWINFLRNHDELSLAYLPEPLLKEVTSTLLKNGESFREGYGVSGRTYSLLESDEKRFLNAYFLLSSLPGGLLLPYGDEFGMTNIPFDQLPEKENHDTRNINRGILSKKEMKSAKGKRLCKKIQEFITARKHLNEYQNVWPIKLHAPSEVFAACYQSGSSRLIVLVNLSPETKKVRFKTENYEVLNKFQRISLAPYGVTLSPFACCWLQK